MIATCPINGCPRRYLKLPFGWGYFRLSLRRGCFRSRGISVKTWKLLTEAAEQDATRP